MEKLSMKEIEKENIQSYQAVDVDEEEKVIENNQELIAQQLQHPKKE